MAHPLLAPGRKALITGGQQGIGRAVAKQFKALGMEVCLVDLPGDRLTAAGEALGVQTEAVDVADQAAMAALAARLGPLDVLMNNAVTRLGRGFEAPLDDWQAAFQVNFWGVIHGVEAFLPAMRTQGSGLIINAGSKQGITNPPGHPIYNAAKAALKSYTESLAHELRQGDAAVSVHLLIPGWTMEEGSEKKPGAWSSDQVGGFMVEALDRGDFYILCPDNDVTSEMDHKRILWGAQDITENRPALTRWHPDWKERATKACS
ncbi:MAG: SDR family oxidoreductase [Pseudomonadota bacterium]